MPLEIEILAAGVRAEGGEDGSAAALRRAARAALRAVGAEDGHMAISLVAPEEIRMLNHRHRRCDRATDVLSFPVDGGARSVGPRELGDVVICPEHTTDLEEAVVHGTLHLLGMDHEVDNGEMLALQAQIMQWLR